MEPVNRAMLRGVASLNGSGYTIKGNSVSCNANQTRERAAVYRFTIRAPPSKGLNWTQIQRDLRVWTLEVRDEIQLDDESFVKIDSTCNPKIFSLEDPLCSPTPLPIGLSTETPAPPNGASVAVSPEGAVSIVLALLLGVAVVVCLILITLWCRTKREARG